jgi:hypothetical protein
MSALHPIATAKADIFGMRVLADSSQVTNLLLIIAVVFWLVGMALANFRRAQRDRNR